MNRSQGAHGAVVREIVAALSASISATPPPPFAKPWNALNSAPVGGCHYEETSSDRRMPFSLVSTNSQVT